MKTDIAKFCKEYETVLRPLIGELEDSAGCIERESRADVLRVTLAGLNDVSLRLKTLADKIRGQQAYLLIFGPLKSGKSTLINAVSSAYVSEVTSLPAYPCLVYVSHGDERTFTVTRYNGKTKTYPDNQALQEAVAHAHASLADRIREKEHEGGEFDPGVDFPEAIRRIDIRLPISNLVESSTVMVDTPGLYSRMKFGYDLMTREFRDSAACAVFVVKTDNLYLEQVFAEFKDLLDLFSRIFLVVNIDSGKRDLRPDGTLQPSLESQHPQKIVEAFETLAMNAQLKDALDDGRLKIYPIDLLNSAADYLKKASGGETGEESETQPEEAPPVASADSAATGTETSEAEDNGEFSEQADETTGEAAEPAIAEEESIEKTDESAPSEPQEVTFEHFLQDLTEYLNSNEYFLGFMRDSLRQGSTLCEETQKHCSPESMVEFRESQEALVREMNDAEAKSQAALELQKMDYQNVFQRVRKESEQKAGELAGGLKDEVASTMEVALHKWYESGDSLRDLLENYFNPILQEFAAKVDAETISRVKTLVDTPYGGADFTGEAMKAIKTLDLSLPDISQNILQKIESNRQPSGVMMAITEENIPMRKTFIDWILFRNQASIRRRVLGAPNDLSLPIPPEVKRKRLGQEGLQAIHHLSVEALNQHFRQIPKTSSDRTMGKYAREFLQKLDESVNASKKDLSEKLKQIQTQMKSDKIIADSLATLSQKAGEIESQVNDLMEAHQCGPERLEEVPAGIEEDWRLLWA